MTATSATPTERFGYVVANTQVTTRSLKAESRAPLVRREGDGGESTSPGESLAEPRALLAESWLESFVRSLAAIDGFRWVIVSDPTPDGVVHLTTWLLHSTSDGLDAVYDAQIALMRAGTGRHFDFHVWSGAEGANVPSVPHAQIVTAWNASLGSPDAHAG